MKFSTMLNVCCLLIVCLFVATTTTFAQNVEADKGITVNESTTINQTEDLGDVVSLYTRSSMGIPYSVTTGVVWVPVDASFWITSWQSDTITRVDVNGNLIERFTVPASATRAITWDGTNVWFGNATTTIRAVNPITRALVTSVTVPEAARFLTYDPTANAGAGGFWLGNWSSPITQVSMTGTTLATIPDNAAYTSRYGAAYDNYSPGGPYLWVYHQAGGPSQATMTQLHIATQTAVNVIDVNAPFGTAELAGGMCITSGQGSVTGNPMIFAMLQNEALVGMGLLDSATITFEINTANIIANGGTIDPTGIYLAGGAGFGVPGDNPATDADGDGIWTVTVTRPFGFSSHYTFLNGNCPGWNCKENIAGLPCADPANFNDRFLPAVYSDTTILACFGACESDGSCPTVSTPKNITFNINMDSAPDSVKNTFTTAYVSGSFNGWSGTANPLTNNGDGTWTATLSIPANVAMIEYKFQTDNWTKDEKFTTGDPCTITDPSGQFVNRVLTITGDEVLPVYCWSACTVCLTGTNGLSVNNNLFTLNPSLVRDFTNINFSADVVNQDKQVFVYNAVGQLVHNTTVNNENIYRLETANFANGLYFVTVKTESSMLTQKFVVSK